MSIKSVKLPIFVSLTKPDSYDRIFLPFFRNAQIYEQRTFSLDYRWIIDSKDTLVQFLNSGGKIRLLVDLELSETDYALVTENDELAIETILRKEIFEPFKRNVPYHEQWAIRYLYHLLDQDIIDLRIEMHPKGSFTHDPVIFLTENKDTILFHGGFFESSRLNYLDVFVSWDQRDLLRINAYRQIFENEWKNKDPRSRTITLPKSLKAEIKSEKEAYNPYFYLLENKQKYRMKPAQQDAIDHLAANGWKGLFCLPIEANQMSLSMFMCDQFILTEPRTVTLIVVPNYHALREWEGFIQSKYPDKPLYSFQTAEEARNSNLSDKIRVKLKEDFIVTITTYQVFADANFQTLLRRSKNTFFYIFDECFLFGSQAILKPIKLADNSARIGFTSTPISWLPIAKKEIFMSTFGPQIWEIPLTDVLGQTLDNYHYQVHLSELIISEYSQYKQLTQLIQTTKSEGYLPEKALQYYNDREKFWEASHNKVEDFIHYFSLHTQKRSLIYVAEEQLELMLQRFQFEFSLKVEVLKPRMSMTHRLRIIKSFLSDQIDVIITTQSFNEGIDSLKPKAIYLLSNPSSPRIFFQRRNLLLTSNIDKKKAIIHDFVTIAPREGLHDAKQKDIVTRELPRVLELSRLAAKSEISELLAYLESLGLRDKFDSFYPIELNQEIYVMDEPLLE